MHVVDPHLGFPMSEPSHQFQDAACHVVMDATPFPHFAKLLHACGPFAAISGGRYTSTLFHDFSTGDDRAVEARVPALPVVADYICQISEAETSETLLAEFRIAERMALREAVFVSMVSTCRSVELWPARADVAVDDITYQDMSAHFDVIAQRLYNFVKARSDAGEDNVHKQRMIAASFIVEFGREHGLQPGEPDEVVEKMLFDFLERAREWGENANQEVLPCFESLPPNLRESAEEWWKLNWKGVACVGGTASIAKGFTIIALCHIPLVFGAVGVAGAGAALRWAVTPTQALNQHEHPQAST
jgi:hypothetical protein